MNEELTFAENSGENAQELEPVLTAIRERDAGRVRDFIHSGGNARARTPEGWTLLQTASAEGALEVVQVLLEHGAEPDLENLCVFFAAQSGNTALVRSLLEAFHLSPGILDPDGNTLLHHAAESGSAELVAFLLEAGLDPRAQGAARLTPLERAAWQGDLEIVRLLVEAGADVNSEGGRWSAPLAEARKPLCEAVYLYGPPLYAAASRGHLPVVRYLVSQGADPNGRDCNGRTALHAASRAENPDCMQFLLSLGAE